MRCPVCKWPLIVERFHGHELNRCHSCRGIWLERSALSELAEHVDPVFGQSDKGETDEGELRCPECRGPMESINYAHDSGVFIRKCAACEGIWLAPGQLERIAGHRLGSPAVQRLAAAITADMQRAKRWQFARNLLRSRVLSGIVVLGYVAAVWLGRGDAVAVFRIVRFLALPLACIWFPDALGSRTGVSFGLARFSISRATPGDIVALAGWILLLCPIAVVLIMNR